MIGFFPNRHFNLQSLCQKMGLVGHRRNLTSTCNNMKELRKFG